jgi:hypothetical protein
MCLEGIQRGPVVCPLRARESLSAAGIWATTADITRGVWAPDRLTEVDPDDAPSPLDSNLALLLYNV